MLSLLFFASLSSAQFSGPASIADLASLSKIMIHHYECRLALLPATGPSKELNFQIDPTAGGHDSTEFPLAQGADKVVASANAQMLQVVWSRNNQVIANSQSWTQNSTTQSFVLMVADPKNDSNQVHLSCNGVPFSDVKK